MKNLSEKIVIFISEKITNVTFMFLLFVWCILPFVYPKITSFADYVNTYFFQIMIPTLIIIAQKYQNIQSEIRQQRTFDMVAENLNEVKKLIKHQTKEVSELKKIHKHIDTILDCLNIDKD